MIKCGRIRQSSSSGIICCGIGIHAIKHVSVRRYFGDTKRVCLLASFFTERVTAADVYRRSAPVIGKSEVDASIATKRSAEQGEEGLVLVNG